MPESRADRIAALLGRAARRLVIPVVAVLTFLIGGWAIGLFR